MAAPVQPAWYTISAAGARSSLRRTTAAVAGVASRLGDHVGWVIGWAGGWVVRGSAHGKGAHWLRHVPEHVADVDTN